jgi:hypothetical protein
MEAMNVPPVVVLAKHGQPQAWLLLQFTALTTLCPLLPPLQHLLYPTLTPPPPEQSILLQKNQPTVATLLPLGAARPHRHLFLERLPLPWEVVEVLARQEGERGWDLQGLLVGFRGK